MQSRLQKVIIKFCLFNVCVLYVWNCCVCKLGWGEMSRESSISSCWLDLNPCVKSISLHHTHPERDVHKPAVHLPFQNTCFSPLTGHCATLVCGYRCRRNVCLHMSLLIHRHAIYHFLSQSMELLALSSASPIFEADFTSPRLTGC